MSPAEYARFYNAGRAAYLRGSAAIEKPHPNAWHDGYDDVAMGLRKWHRRDCTAFTAKADEATALAHLKAAQAWSAQVDAERAEALTEATDLPLDVYGVGIPRGTRIHLVSEDSTKPAALCGQATHLNPRYVGKGFSFATVSPDRADCPKCRRIALDPAYGA